MTRNARALGAIHTELLDAAALAALLAAEITNRHVDPRDRGLPDLGAVAALLARELERLRDACER